MVRRKGAEDSATRMAIIECATKVIEEHGIAAVTARRITTHLQLSRYIVHYYFGTIEELLVAIMRLESEKALGWYAEALKGGNPLRVIWEHPATSDPKIHEFTAMARTNKAIAAEMRQSIEDLNRVFTAAVERHIALCGVAPSVPATAIVTITLAIARALAEGKSLGVTESIEQSKSTVEEWIDEFGKSGIWPVASRAAFT